MAAKFAQWDAEMEEEETQPASPSRLAGRLVFAGLLLLLAVALWFWWLKPPVAAPPAQTGPAANETQKANDTLPAKPIEAAPAKPDPASRIIACAAPAGIGKFIEDMTAVQRGSGVPKSFRDTLLAQAELAFRQAKYRQAAGFLTQIPDSSAQKWLAFAYHRLGRHAEAIEAYQRYMASDPSNVEKHDWNLALLYLDTVTLNNDMTIPVSENYRALLRARLGNV